MKTKILMLIVILGVMIACGINHTENEPYDPTCHRPDDIPDTLCDGTEVYWDCSWQASYVEGDVDVTYTDEGCARFVSRKVSGVPSGAVEITP